MIFNVSTASDGASGLDGAGGAGGTPGLPGARGTAGTPGADGGVHVVVQDGNVQGDPAADASVEGDLFALIAALRADPHLIAVAAPLASERSPLGPSIGGLPDTVDWYAVYEQIQDVSPMPWDGWFMP